MKKSSKAVNSIKTCYGFSLVEALLSVVLLGLMATGMVLPYVSGFQSLDVQADHMLLDSRLRSRMEVLISRPFAEVLAQGSHTDIITVRGKHYTISWSAVPVDLDGDATPELNAMQLMVSLAGRSLTTLLVDHQGRLGKI